MVDPDALEDLFDPSEASPPACCEQCGRTFNVPSNLVAHRADPEAH